MADHPAPAAGEQAGAAEPAGPARQADQAGAPGRARYLHDLHIALIGVLLAVSAGASVAAWRLHPASNGFQAVPQDLTIVTSGSEFELTETLTPAGGTGAQLEVQEPRAFRGGQPLADKWLMESGGVGVLESLGPLAQLDGAPLPNNSWDYIILNPGRAQPCPSLGGYKSGNVQLPWLQNPVPAIVVKERRPQVATEDHPNLVLCLRWTAASPADLKGAYLSARFPPVHGTAITGTGADAVAVIESGDDRDLAMGQVTRVLKLQRADTSDFNLQTDPHPAVDNQQSWTWTTKDSPEVIQVAALNTTDAQHENNNAFYSGILFGLAGSAIIALITELVQPLHRSRRRARPPFAGP